MLTRIKETFIKLVKMNNSPREIALGVALGVFISTLPLYGLHTVLMVLAAVTIRRANKLTILLGTNFSLPPTVPFITWAGYEIGRRVINPGYPPLTWQYFANFSLARIKEFYYPLFVGSVILGILCAFLFYFLAFWLAKRWKERRANER